MNAELIYLYCVTNRMPKLSRPVIEMKAGSRPLLDGMAGKDLESLVDSLYFIYHRGLYAIVGKVKETEFGEENLKKNLVNLEWVKDKATVHEKIIEVIMNPALSASKRRYEVKKGGVENSYVIPFKFGTLFNTEDNLKAMLGEHLSAFKAILKHLEGKEEWGVKIYCDIEKLKESLLREDKDLLNMDKEINGSTTLTIDPERSRRVNSPGPGKAFILKKKKEESLNTVMNKKLNEYGQYSFERLSRYGADARINKLLPKEVTERKDEMILNSAFLIDKNKVTDFLNTIEGLKTRYVEKGVFIDCTGPWPPYNFCETQTYGAQRT